MVQMVLKIRALEAVTSKLKRREICDAHCSPQTLDDKLMLAIFASLADNTCRGSSVLWRRRTWDMCL